MATNIKPSIAEPTARYTWPICDADTHLWETDEAWSAYLP